MKKTVIKTIEKRRLKSDYKPLVVKHGIKQKGSVTVPDQSLSVQDIISRFTRGIPVAVVQRDPVYMDQTEHDFEAMSRKDFADKAAIAAEMAERSESIKGELEENARKLAESKRKASQKKDSGTVRQDPGIDPLDNTMPDDTKN